MCCHIKHKEALYSFQYQYMMICNIGSARWAYRFNSYCSVLYLEGLCFLRISLAAKLVSCGPGLGRYMEGLCFLCHELPEV